MFKAAVRLAYIISTRHQQVFIPDSFKKMFRSKTFTTSLKASDVENNYFNLFETWMIFNIMCIQVQVPVNSVVSLGAKTLRNLRWPKGQRLSQTSSHYSSTFLYYNFRKQYAANFDQENNDIKGKMFFKTWLFYGRCRLNKCQLSRRLTS